MNCMCFRSWIWYFWMRQRRLLQLQPWRTCPSWWIQASNAWAGHRLMATRNSTFPCACADVKWLAPAEYWPMPLMAPTISSKRNNVRFDGISRVDSETTPNDNSKNKYRWAFRADHMTVESSFIPELGLRWDQPLRPIPRAQMHPGSVFVRRSFPMPSVGHLWMLYDFCVASSLNWSFNYWSLRPCARWLCSCLLLKWENRSEKMDCDQQSFRLCFQLIN